MSKAIAASATAALVIAAGVAIGVTAMEKKEKEPVPLKPELSVKDGQYSPETMLALGRMSDPQVSPDGKWLLYGISYTDIALNKAVRNLYISGIDGKDECLVTESPTSISNARWCCDGKKIAYLMGGQVYLCSASNRSGVWKLGKPRKISDVPADIGEFKLSPDESQILYTSTVKSHVDKPSDLYEDLDKATAYEAKDLMYRHWDHWVEEIPHSYVTTVNLSGKDASFGPVALDILGGPDVPYELPTEPFSGIEQLCWSPDSRFIAYSCRKKEGKQYAFSTCSDIFIYDILTGETTAVTNGGGYDTDPVWSPDGKHLAWLSMERDGYEADKTRLMVCPLGVPEETEGQSSIRIGQTRELTSAFKYNAAGPVWASDGTHIWFNALAEGLQGIFKASLDGEIERVTSKEDWHDFDTPFHFNDDGSMLSTWQSLNFPSEIVKVSAKGEAMQVSNVNSDVISQLPETKTEARYIKTVDGQDMLTWIMYPPHFDPSKKYPAILICLGGPQGTISQSWSYRWNYRLMASQGYVVILPNRRGTTAFGQEWTEQISGDYCGLNIQDYLSAAQELKKEPYIGKMAACGASYGGYSVYYLMGMHGDTFDCFIAHAGIFNEEHMYYTTEEMWFPNWDNGGLKEYSYNPDAPVGPAGDGITFGGMQQAGSPWSTEPKAVRHYENSPHKLVRNWHTPLLCIHGGSDFRVPVDEGMAAFNCAQMMGVPSRLIVFPDENHWILKPQNALFWHREYFKWLDKWCKE